MKLYIAEKPELAKAIAKGLGGGDRKDGYIDCGQNKVTWCFGHLLELFDPEDYDPKYKKWNLSDLPIFHNELKRKPIKGKETQLKVIKKLLKEAKIIVNAGDPDEEGQLLVDEILDYYKVNKPVKRVLINDLNDSLVKKSLNNLKDNEEFKGLYYSALGRSISDKSYGYNLTRAYTLSGQKKGLDKVLSVGRVQTPVLGLIVNRDHQHENHIKSNYYNIVGEFSFKDRVIFSKYQPAKNDPVDDKKRINEPEFSKKVKLDCENRSAKIDSLQSENKKSSPPLLYNLLNLQADCHRKFGIKPDEVLKITQELREKYQLITYNRSDCQYLSDEHHADASTVLKAIAINSKVLRGSLFLADKNIKSRVFNSKNVTAHHAIIPTIKQQDISNLPENLQKVYLLIARSYVAQFYPKEEFILTTIKISCEGYKFQSKYKKVTLPGWRVLYKNDKDNEDIETSKDIEETNIDFASLKGDSLGLCVEIKVTKKETKPQARYTLATLLKDLARVSKYVADPTIKKLLQEKDKDKKGESGGIGTPATRSEIIKTLFKRDFVKEEGKKLVSTDLGREFIKVLPDSVTTPDMTALWHEQQLKIQKKEVGLSSFLDNVKKFIAIEVENVKNNGLSIEASGFIFQCPTCKDSVLKLRSSKNGSFWGCTGYPECKATFPDNKGKPDFNKIKPTSKPTKLSQYKCLECQNSLVKRKSKNGAFWGCSIYPKCKSTYPDNKNKPILTAI